MFRLTQINRLIHRIVEIFYFIRHQGQKRRITAELRWSGWSDLGTKARWSERSAVRWGVRVRSAERSAVGSEETGEVGSIFTGPGGGASLHPDVLRRGRFFLLHLAGLVVVEGRLVGRLVVVGRWGADGRLATSGGAAVDWAVGAVGPSLAGDRWALGSWLLGGGGDWASGLERHVLGLEEFRHRLEADRRRLKIGETFEGERERLTDLPTRHRVLYP